MREVWQQHNCTSRSMNVCACRWMHHVPGDQTWCQLAYLKYSNLYRNHSTYFVLCSCIVLFAESHDVDTLQAGVPGLVTQLVHYSAYRQLP